MGRQNKLLVPLSGVPTIVHTVQTLLVAELDPVVVVTGHERERVAAAVGPQRAVFNPRFAEGMGTSVAAGVDALPRDIGGFLICPGDMPWIRSTTIRRLVDALAAAGPESIVVPVHGGRRGNPVLFGIDHREAVQESHGDRGARDLVAAQTDLVIEVTVDDEGVGRDIDTPEELAKASHDPPEYEGPAE